jgi:Uma2 family endonuclease
MSNEELETHNKVKAEIDRVLLNLNKELRLGNFFCDGVLITNVNATVSNNPDATFITWDSLEQERVRLVPRKGKEGQYIEIEGTPDWVLEVVSASSVQKDNKKLRAAYHRAGIPEYWLVDARRKEISFQILRWHASGYVAEPARRGWQRSQVFPRMFKLVRQPVRYGLWEYTLNAKVL